LISIRGAKAGDMESLSEIDHNYTTEYVWQMDLDQEGAQTMVRFRESRLPRIMSVAYPQSSRELTKTWKKQAAFLVAHEEEEVLGYISLSSDIAPQSLWVTSLAVSNLKRRQGIGSQLILAAQAWATQNDHQRIVLEMQSKNYPAIRFAQKLAFEFCGYNDRYYENQDIALFFAKQLF